MTFRCTPPLKSLLAFRLSLMLMLIIGTLWLLWNIPSLYFKYQAKHEQLLEELQSSTHEIAVHQRKSFEVIVQDLKTLLLSWQTMIPLEGVDIRYRVAKYIPDTSGKKTTDKAVNHAMSFVESYGSGGIGGILNTFILMDSGIAISTANSSMQIDQLPMLKNLAFVKPKNGILWGSPYQSQNGQWRIAAGIRDSLSGNIIGMTMLLPEHFGSTAQGDLSASHLIWIDDEGKPLSPKVDPKELAIAEKLPTCIKTFATHLDNYRIVCSSLSPGPWRILKTYPESELVELSGGEMKKSLLIAVGHLLILVLVLYSLLQRKLGKPLQTMVSIIEGQANTQTRLPENRDDELGQVAKSYNHLRDDLDKQYRALEDTVAKRTAELDDARKRAEEASANKSWRIACINHEIRTPLNGIIGALTLMRQKMSNAERESLIETALSCSEQQLEIISNLLDFERIEAGKMILHSTLCDALPLLDQSILTIKSSAITKGISLKVLAQASYPQTLFTDFLKVRQILVNLLGNAVKFTQEGSISLTTWSNDSYIYFKVQDTGPGIPAEKCHEIFIPYRQLDAHTPGNGLGLPIASRLAQHLGGNLKCEPQDTGACFLLSIPQHRQTASLSQRGPIKAPLPLHTQLQAWGFSPEIGENESLAAPELAHLPAKLYALIDPQQRIRSQRIEIEAITSIWSLKILVVDDVEVNRTIVRKMLMQLGHHVFEADSGNAALELGKKHIFDLVLLDRRMPGLSSEQTLVAWRDESKKILDSGCPIVILTANAQNSERERLMKLGFSDYLSKPLTPSMIIHLIDLVADLQISRGIELESNTGRSTLQIWDDNFHARFYTSLQKCHDELAHVLISNDLKQCENLLHALKGLAGQGGLDILYDTLEIFEKQIATGENLSQENWVMLGHLIESSSYDSQPNGQH